MKFSHKWLKKYLETTATPAEISERLIGLGLEVESLDDPSKNLKGFVYAQVVEREKHPNADRLSLCKVDAGTGELIQVVCGASNVKANMGVAFAPVGTVIPITKEALKKGNIRNVDSFGMLCSSKELLLDEEAEGIMDLGLEHKPGTPLTEVIEYDAVFDISITPNRGDCFSVYGIARDLAAVNFGTLKKLAFTDIARNDDTPPVEKDTDLCTQFSLCHIKDVKNTSSPIWLQNLLNRAGQKSISALVDITNYFCIGLGRPMHVFDADKIQGSIVVRKAKKGEILKALNDQDYSLEEGMIVIADDRSIISLAGIMGSRETAVDEKTTNVLLESAYFDPVSIAITGQHLNLISDSRMRFERGVDCALISPCLDMATAMILEICGGKAANPYHAGAHVLKSISITLQPKQVERRLGLKVDADEISHILQQLGCSIEKDSSLIKIIPPSWRHDLVITEDLIEEIARMKGYKEIHAQSLPLKPVHNFSSRETLTRKHLCNRGFLETINWSFIDKKSAEKFTEKQELLVHLKNPITEDFAVMRPSLLCSLLEVAKFNSANARPNGSLFEIAPIYGTHFPNKQETSIAGLRFGNTHERHWLAQSRNVDVFDVKADVLETLRILGVSETSVQLNDEGPSYYHPGRKGTFKQGNRILAHFGEIHPGITSELNAIGFEVFLNQIHQTKAKKVQTILSDLMPVRRDFAFVLETNTSAQTLVKAVEKASDLIIKVDVFDCYQGPHLEKDKKSIALSVTLQPTEKTLDEAAFSHIHKTIIEAASKINAHLR
ncbi:MAG: phenylalanine--tRNA ligase subunit beta [Pseudomonadota bacterium]|jgi:phenylalanyl-tRNA synthetase beta chain|nr:phenylalanine--tRNA ligase subunit beta [Alphaproteobacteria bacterium]